MRNLWAKSGEQEREAWVGKESSWGREKIELIFWWKFTNELAT